MKRRMHEELWRRLNVRMYEKMQEMKRIYEQLWKRRGIDKMQENEDRMYERREEKREEEKNVENEELNL